MKVQIEPQRAVISNDYLSLEYSLAHGRVRTSTIQNLRASKAFPAQGEDFVLEFADGRAVKSSDAHLEKARMEASGPDGKRLVLELSLHDLRLRLITEMQAAQWWATRWLEISGGTGRLRGISLASWRSTKAVGPAGAGNLMNTLGYPSGCGQAAYSQDLFFAMGDMILGVRKPRRSSSHNLVEVAIMDQITRRSFLKKAACLGGGALLNQTFVSSLAQTSPQGSPAQEMKTDLVAVKGKDPYASTLRAIQGLGGIEAFVGKGHRVGLLVNSPFKNIGASVNPDIVLAVINKCLDGGTKEIRYLKDPHRGYWERSPKSGELASMLKSLRYESGEHVKVDIPGGLALKDAR